MRWVGTVDDSEHGAWVKQMKQRNPDFLDDDPSLGPQECDWCWNHGYGLLDWDGRFNETWDEQTLIDGGIYGHSDDEHVG